jgi:HEAT repeat protein
MDYTEIDVLMASEESADRRMAATMLGESGEEGAVARLLRLLKDPNSGVRDAAQSSLMFTGGKRAVELVAPLVAQIDPGLRNAAIDILRKIGDDGIDVLTGLAVAKTTTSGSSCWTSSAPSQSGERGRAHRGPP